MLATVWEPTVSRVVWTASVEFDLRLVVAEARKPRTGAPVSNLFPSSSEATKVPLR
jgi:hypothetical protein